MIPYILEILLFQLAFLLVYDLFLKNETFFQWNRVYLLVTYILSLILPWVKIEAFKTIVTSEYAAYTQTIFQLDTITLGADMKDASLWLLLFWYEWVFFIGVLIMALLFIVKLFKIQLLKQKGEKKYYANYTKVVIAKSEVAFSFFKSVFLGDSIPKEKETNIVAHELVHIKQWHSLDLLFFEVMRIVFWFNPLTYIYQSRISVLHEFIADAHVSKDNKKGQYQLLLSEVFQTEHISFVNQFFKSSLIKKRIVMLQRKKSQSILKLKYIMLIPLVALMIVYTSCELEGKKNDLGGVEAKASVDEEVAFMTVDEVPVFPGCESATDKQACFKEKVMHHIKKHFNYPQEAQEEGIQGRVSIVFTITKDGTIDNIRKRGPHELLENEAVRIINRLPKMIPGQHDGKAVDVPFSIPITFRLSDENFIQSEIKNFTKRAEGWVPFAKIEEAPVFPGCENATDTKACFLESIQNHIKKHFNYPEEAQQLGVQGRVAVMFIIDENGEVTNIEEKGPHQLLEDEVERIIKRLPKMKPGKANGQAVKVPFSIPITFKLQ